MRILHVVAGSAQGGAETYCLDAIKALHERGVEQHVICRPHSNYLSAFKQLGISYSVESFSFLSRLLSGKRKVKSIIETFKPDVVHAWMGRGASFIPTGVTVPVLGWFGGYYELERYKNCDCFVGVTKDIKRHLDEKTGAVDRCFVVHTFGTLEDMPDVERTEFDTPEDVPVVLLLSRMHWKKGVDVLLRAAQKIDNAYFWLAGDGPDIEKYKALSTELGVDHKVRFLGWRNDRAALLKQADICALPSRYEPFGTVIAEAWYANVPLVSSKASGAVQYVTHDQDGLLFDIDNVEQLTECINRLIADKQLRAQIVAGGKQQYEALFSRDVSTTSLLDTYQKVLKLGKK